MSKIYEARGVSVTQRIKQIKQPRGGYIPPKNLSVICMESIEELCEGENIHPTLVGITVDYLSRFMSGTPASQAFSISILGARLIGETEIAKSLLLSINGLDDHSIICAVKLSGFDVCYRSGCMGYKPVQDINPNKNTIKNIRIMVQRALIFFEKYGPIVLNGFRFDGGYTNIITSGDGDFLTENTLWEFKVSKLPVKKEQTLQLFIYWRMGLHSIYSQFDCIEFLGIFNPRMNTVSRLCVYDIPKDVVEEIDTEIIGYHKIL